MSVQLQSRVGRLALGALVLTLLGALAAAQSTPGAPPSGRMPKDPGVRGGPPAAGGPIQGLSSAQLAYFTEGASRFSEIDSVQGTEPGASDTGLGPRFNMNSCAGCHAQPVTGGSSPPVNPQIAVATRYGARNSVPPFIQENSPVREARFKSDGGVHDLFTITGRQDAKGCNIQQPDFASAAASGNLIFRVPTPLFGAGLIEAILDSTVLANESAGQLQKRMLGISGHENRNPNDGTITRFGWKAQNKSPVLFGAEAYNVEQGVTNDVFPTERDETPGCVINTLPEDHTTLEDSSPTAAMSDVVGFGLFMRFLAPPTPGPSSRSTENGQKLFGTVGCASCHTPSFTTGPSSFPALANQTANLFSDLLVHDMGSNLADGITQGMAGPDEFRTSPLWGLGQRLFFLHDGRTSDLLEAIQAHSSPGSEANRVIQGFNALQPSQQQDILNFLRSL
jgi:CxxC motif-containing protein (DUF1111 family)